MPAWKTEEPYTVLQTHITGCARMHRALHHSLPLLLSDASCNGRNVGPGNALPKMQYKQPTRDQLGNCMLLTQAENCRASGSAHCSRAGSGEAAGPTACSLAGGR